MLTIHDDEVVGLICPVNIFQKSLEILMHRKGGQNDRPSALFWAVESTRPVPGRNELLVRSVLENEPRPTKNSVFLHVEIVSSTASFSFLIQETLTCPPHILGNIKIGVDDAQGLAWSALRGSSKDGVSIPMSLKLRGSGMREMVLDPTLTQLPVFKVEEVSRYSRFAGSVGGMDVFSRIRGLSIAILGAGGTGSRVADYFARLGCYITIIDPDVLEPWNVSQMAASTPDQAGVGKSKVEALREKLLPHWNGESHQINAIESSGHLPSASVALKRSDFIFVAADHDSARITANRIGISHLKPIIDIGVGIQSADSQERNMGFDIRLIDSGLPGCLECFGGLIDQQEGWDRIQMGSREPSEDTWKVQRSGSTGSLNGVAVGMALRLFEDYMSERMSGHQWIHAAFSPEGRLEVEYQDALIVEKGCSVCVRQSF